MLNLSDLLIRHREIESFRDLLALIRSYGEKGERFLNMDIKPDFRDTPRNWESHLESAFTWAGR